MGCELRGQGLWARTGMFFGKYQQVVGSDMEMFGLPTLLAHQWE